MTPDEGRTGDVIPLREATRTWFAISLQTFGGPAGQIAVMQHKLVDEKRWIGQKRFLHALNYCMLLPGPEAQQLAIYVGWLLNGTAGGLIAGALFVLPGAIALLALSALYVGAGSTALVTGLFAGLAPAVIAIVIQAVHRVGTRALHHPILVAMAVASFAALTVFTVPFPIVILLAGLLGWLFSLRIPALTHSTAHAGAPAGPEPLISDDALRHDAPSTGRTVKILVVGLILWFAPIALAALVFSRDSVFVDQGLFFSGAAVVTFGGAYAVLSYVAHQAVFVYGWLAPGEMVRGLALAETTPRRLRRRLPQPRIPRPVGRRTPCFTAGDVGDLRALLPVHLSRRAVRRAAAQQPPPHRSPHRRHGRGRRSDREPRCLLRAAYPLWTLPAPQVGSGGPRTARAVLLTTY